MIALMRPEELCGCGRCDYCIGVLWCLFFVVGLWRVWLWDRFGCVRVDGWCCLVACEVWALAGW